MGIRTSAIEVLSRVRSVRSIITAAAAAWLLVSAPALAQKWVTAAPVPQGAEEVYGIVAGGKLYVFGGLAIAWKPIGMVMEYDPATDQWTRKRDMPAYHHHFALAEAGGRIYMFGGYTLPEKGQPTWIPVNNSWEYDPQADTWKPLAPVPTARGSASAVTVNGRVHLIGGAALPAGAKEDWLHPSRNVSISTHDVFDPASNTWSKRADMPTARNHAASGVVDGRIYVAGGEIRHRDFWGTYTTVESYDPKSNSWARLPPMPLPRHGLAGGFIGNRFHLVSGSVQSGTNIPGLVTSTDRHDVLVIGGN